MYGSTKPDSLSLIPASMSFGVLIEIANAVEAVQDGRIHIEKINWPFLHDLRVTPAEYKAGSNVDGFGCTRAAPT
jgi:hypothetical protein